MLVQERSKESLTPPGKPPLTELKPETLILKDLFDQLDAGKITSQELTETVKKFIKDNLPPQKGGERGATGQT